MSVFWIVLCWATAAQAVTPYQSLEATGQAGYWRRLLHYEETLFGNHLSLVDSPLFFLHKEGKGDPAKELEADIQAFQDPAARAGYLNQHPQCVFPERYRFVKQAGLIHTEDIHCADFLEWKKGIGAEAIILVFSSSFPNNPASAFGHTFIRFRRKELPDLLDYSASFAALTGDDDLGPIYAIKGLLGGYEGRFALDPYYLKVNEYNNSESRDLYEYELDLSRESVDRIVNHLWELYASGYFDYYFLDENCSYILSRVLDLAGSDWNLSQTYRWYYLPVDSLKRLAEIPGAIRSIRFRPSQKKKLAWRMENLSMGQRDRLTEIQSGRLELEDETDVRVLDTLVAYWNFRKHEEKQDFSAEDKARFRDILLYRARFQEKSPEPQVPHDPENRPDAGHGASRITLGGGRRNDANIYRVNFFSGWHNLLSDDWGMEPYSQIDLLGIGLEYDEAREETTLSHVTLIDILSLHPYTYYDPQLSWKVSSRYEPIENLPCRDCYKTDLDVGFGASFQVGSGKTLVYLLGGLFIEHSPHYERSYGLGPALEWALFANPTQAYRILARQAIRKNVRSGTSKSYYWVHSLGQSISLGRNWEIHLTNQFFSEPDDSRIRTRVHDLQVWYYF